MLDLKIINAELIDGSGAPRKKGSIGIQNGKLVLSADSLPAAQVLDARGRVVCPGFIDAHSHGDRLIGTEDGRLFKTPQGITTELCGHCGSSYAPVKENRQKEIFSVMSFFHPLEEAKKWTTFEAFLDFVEKQPLSANARFYVGHKLLRLSAMGLENRPATPSELETMKSLLREAMEAGAAGMSTGLIYVPSCYAGPEEIVELAKVVASHNGIYTSHMRNESDALESSVQEVLEVGRQTGVRLNISHLKVQGKKNWGKHRTALEWIARANEVEGIHTTCDLYPYPRSMNNMASCVPPEYFSSGMDVFVNRLSDPAFRRELRERMSSYDTPYDNFYLNSGGWDGVYIASSDATPEAAGKFVSEYASEQGKDPFDAYFDMMAANQGRVNGVYCTMDPENVCEIVQSPYCVIGTDGCTASWKHKGHPRASAAFPRTIEFFVKERKIFTLEEMIRKMTSLTAERLMVKNKGLLKDGYDADLLLLDPSRLKVVSTYDDPNRKTEGIDCVIVNGKTVYRDMEFTGEYSGKVLRK